MKLLEVIFQKKEYKDDDETKKVSKKKKFEEFIPKIISENSDLIKKVVDGI